MTIQQLMQDMNISRYRLSKISGIPWATLADIYSGKTHLDRCGAGTLSKLSKALGLTIEELLELESEPTESISDGKPNRKTYLEIELSGSIQKAIKDYLQGEKEQVLFREQIVWAYMQNSCRPGVPDRNTKLWAKEILTL